MAPPILEPTAPPNRAARRVRTWLSTWSPILPLLVAEFVVWLGFGGRALGRVGRGRQGPP